MGITDTELFTDTLDVGVLTTGAFTPAASKLAAFVTAYQSAFTAAQTADAAAAASPDDKDLAYAASLADASSALARKNVALMYLQVHGFASEAAAFAYADSQVT